MRGSCAIWIIAIFCAGCSWFGSNEQVQIEGPRLAEVIDELPRLILPDATPPPINQDDVLAAYERVYGSIPDLAQNRAVGKRMADLHMDRAENLDMEGMDNPYADAVALYEGLLKGNASEDQDQILYQLARAYDLNGNAEQAVAYIDRLVEENPESLAVLEARFRRAEIAFSNENYRAAADDYKIVVAAGPATTYWLNANYMLGWSQFKISELDESLASFYRVIDSMLGDRSLDKLPATEQELLNDSFRVVTLALGYLDGAETLARQMEASGFPAWQYLAYQRLADDYLANARYLDSVQTWQTFIDHNGLDARAPNAHLGMIDTLVSADFPSEVWSKKIQFVERYGVHGEFWQVHGETVRNGYTEHLKIYLNELAQQVHGLAQAMPDTAKGKDNEEEQNQARKAAFLDAARWYEELIATFPSDSSTAEHLFLLGDVYTEAGEFGRAVASYQAVIRQFPDFERAAEAGYAAVLGLQQLVASSPQGELELWQRLKIDAQIEFSLNFPTDTRAPVVQADAADGLFNLAEFESAVKVAADSLNTWPDQSAELKKTLYLIAGHGQFELGAYFEAEKAYLLLETLGLPQEEAGPIREKLLASIYRQGEAAEAADRLDDAITHFLRIKAVDFYADLAIQGHFDTAGLLEHAGRTAQAAEILTRFQSDYPDHQLNKGLDMRLAGLYEVDEDWTHAAATYERLAESGADAEIRRQALYRAAEIYLETKQTSAAYGSLSRYVESYPRPQDIAMEAVHQLDTLARQTTDKREQRRWLQKKIDLHQSMGSQATQRAAFLAADAQLLLAEDDRVAFEALTLTHPLKQSLAAKQKALKRSLKSYEKVAAYKVMEFSTAATFQIANLYSSLSKAIMASDRPANLSSLELDQYEILLEEQAFPFEEQAIGLHEINMRRSWDGVYDDWVQQSFAELRRLMPARFDKQEIQVTYVDQIY